MKGTLSTLLMTGLIITGCDSGPASIDNSDDDKQTADVSVNFKLLSPRGAKQAAGATIEGTNGTIVLEDVRFLIAEFELEAENADCATAEDDDDCAEFEAGPFFFQVPLGVESITVAAGAIPFGTYDQFEFEVEDLEDDGDESAANADLLTQIRETEGFSDWPEKASMILVGSFTPTGGAPEEFRVYAEAEVEVEVDLDPPIVIDSETTDYAVDVAISPSDWLKLPDGSVVDLRQFDFAATAGSLLEFDLELENGFSDFDLDD